MKKVNIFLVSTIKGAKTKNGYAAYTLEYYRDGIPFPATITEYENLEEFTENQAVIEILIRALKRMKEGCELEIYTESEYMYHSMENTRLWENNDWKTKAGKEVKNADKWKELLELLRRNLYKFHLKEHNEYTNLMKREAERKRKNV